MLYLIAILLGLTAAWALAGLWPGLQGGFDRLVSLLVLFPGLQVVIALGLGLLKILTPPALLAAQAIVAAIGLLLLRLRRGGTPTVPRCWLRRLKGALRNPWFWPLLAGGTAAAAWLIYIALQVPPFGWDALSYHLPPAVWWLQAGKIYPAPTQFTFGYGYPQGWSLILLWQLAFTATDRLANIAQAPMLLLGLLAAYGLAREVGVGRRFAAWAGLFWALSPLVLEQLTVPYNDLTVSALTLAAFYFVLRYWRRGENAVGALAMAGAAAGLVCSIKSNGVLVLGLVGLAGLLPVLRPAGAYLRQVTVRWLAAGLPALLLAGFWYIRDLLLYRNPLYPARISLLGKVVIPGPRTVTDLLNVTPGQTRLVNFALSLNEYIPRYTYDSPTGGFGAVFTCLGGAAALAALLHAAGTGRRRFVALMAAGLLLYLAQPFKYPRYSLFAPALAGIGFAYLLQHLAGRRRRVPLQAAAAALMLYTLLLVPFQPQLSPETIWQARTARAEGRRISAADFGLARHYGFVNRMPELSDPANLIAYTEGAFVYPLMGPDRDRVIYHVPADSYESWLDQLLRQNTTFLVVGNEKAVENWWARSHPNRFVKWGESWPFTVYLVKSENRRNQRLLEELGSGGQPS